MPKVFISHSSQDNVLADAIAQKVESWGYEAFVDFSAHTGIIGGAQWEAEILTAIKESAAVLVCFTESVTNSLWCFGETLIARYEPKPVIPLLLRGSEDDVWGFLRQTIQVIDLRTDPERGYQRLQTALAQLAPTGNVPSKPTTQQSADPVPYAGLASLTEDDSRFFFGRGNDLQLSLVRLQPAPLQNKARRLTITGASGSGKSSLMAAALLPALRRGALPGSSDWTYLPMSPGTHPSRRLAEAIRRQVPNLGSTRRLTETLDEDSHALSFVLSDVLAESGTETLCIVIDQLEELVTASPVEVADSFGRGLLTAMDELEGRLVIITTVRIDMLEPLLTRSVVGGRLLEDPFVLAPLSRSEIEQVISGPAAAVGWAITPELVRRLVEDSSHLNDPLPLLSFVLRAMFEAASPPGRIAVPDYERTGGVAAALALEAEAVLASVDEDERQAVASAIARTLVISSSEDSIARRRARRSELPVHVMRSLESLVAARLLVADIDPAGEPTLEIAHEAILRHWPRLREAIDVLQTDVRYARRVLQGARENWVRRRSLPTREDATLILASAARLTFEVDDVEVLARWSLATLEGIEWLFEEVTSRPHQGRDIIDRILNDDSGLSQYGLLVHSANSKISSVIPPIDVARQLVGSPVEAVSRAARRELGNVDQSNYYAEIQAGKYAVGPRESPVEVTTDGFSIGRFLVTNLEYAEYVDATGAPWPAHWPANQSSTAVEAVRSIADYPIVYVTYFDAIKYCDFRSTDVELVRLPWETEWEIAHQGDSTDTQFSDFPWGDEFDPARCNTTEGGSGRASLVGYYSHLGGDSHLGVSDLAGNVWEWTASRGRRPDGSPVGLSEGDDFWDGAAHEWAPRVQRGGTFLADAEFARRPFRLVNLPDLALQDFGFRVVRVPSRA